PVTQPSEAHYDVSPDGRELCYVADNVKTLGLDVNLDLFTRRIDEAGAKFKNITPDNPANDSDPAYSPDGKHIAYVRQSIKFFYADQTRLMVYDRMTGTSQEPITDRGYSVTSPKWLPDSNGLFLEVEQDGYHRVGLASPFFKPGIRMETDPVSERSI